jgi:hypothetical protein
VDEGGRGRERDRDRDRDREKGGRGGRERREREGGKLGDGATERGDRWEGGGVPIDRRLKGRAAHVLVDADPWII